MRIVVTLLVASCCIALASGNVNAVTVDTLTYEGMAYNCASILTEVPIMYRQAKMTARGITVQQEQEENQRGK
jgi:hypothetical protein